MKLIPKNQKGKKLSVSEILSKTDVSDFKKPSSEKSDKTYLPSKTPLISLKRKELLARDKETKAKGGKGYLDYLDEQARKKQKEKEDYELAAKGQSRIGNAISDVGTGVAILGTQFRYPTETEYNMGRGSWSDRINLLSRAGTVGIINEMLPGAMQKLSSFKLPSFNKTPSVNWYDQFHKGELRNILPEGYTGARIERGVSNYEAVDDFFNTGIIRNNMSANRPLTKRSMNYGERVFYGPEGGGGLPRNQFTFIVKNSDELTKRPVTYRDVEDIIMKQPNGSYISMPDWKSKIKQQQK